MHLLGSSCCGGGCGCGGCFSSSFSGQLGLGWSLQAEGSDEPLAPDPDPIPAPGPVPPAAAAALSRRNGLHENSGPPLPWDSRAAEHSVRLEEEDEEVEEEVEAAAVAAGVGAAPDSGLIP